MKFIFLLISLILVSSFVISTDLKDYPEPFLKDGEWTGLIVIGANAAASDVVGAIDVAATVGTETTVTEEEDEKPVSSSNDFEITDQFFLHTSTAKKSNLQALADGSIQNEFGTFEYTQFMDLPPGSTSIVYAIDPDDETDTPQYHIKILQDTNAYKYRVSFQPALVTEHKTATSTDTSDYLKGLKDYKLTLLGKDYYVANAEHAGLNNIKLTLIGITIKDTLLESQTKTYTIDGEDYEITLDFVDSTQAKFKVNGQETRKLKDGETDKLSDGTMLSVSEILYQNFAGGIHSATFELGAEEIELKDTDTKTHDFDGSVKINGNTLNKVKLNIKTTNDTGVSDGNKVEISAIEVRYRPSDNLYIPVGGKLSEVADKIEGEKAVLDGYDIEFRGLLNAGSTKDIKIKPSGKYNYKVEFLNIGYQQYSVKMLGCTTQACNTINYGYLDGTTFRNLHFNESEEIADEELFVITGGVTSHILKFKKLSKSEQIITIKDMAEDGETYEISYSDDNSSELELSGKVHTINVSGTNISVDLNADGDFNDINDIIYITATAHLRLGGNENIINLTSDKYAGSESTDNLQAGISWDSTNSELDINDSLSVGYLYGFDISALTVGNTKIEEGTTRFGIYTKWDYTNDQTELLWKYPNSQIFVDLWITGKGKISEETTISAISLLGQDISKLDNEVTDKAANNLILVGGSCANTLTSEVMGNPQPCTKYFEEGKAMIKLYENVFDGNKSALVVAGYSAQDTRNAAAVLKNYSNYALSGQEIIVTSKDGKISVNTK